MLFYDKLQQLAADYGVKLTTVSKKTGISINTMRNWNKVEPSISSLITLAQYFDVSVDFLIGYTNDAQSHKSDMTKAVEALVDIRSVIDQKIETLKAEGPVLESFSEVQDDS